MREMQSDEILHPFDPTGLTPPKGRLGHSLPTPRILGGDVMAANGPAKGIMHQFSGANAIVRLLALPLANQCYLSTS